MSLLGLFSEPTSILMLVVVIGVSGCAGNQRVSIPPASDQPFPSSSSISVETVNLEPGAFRIIPHYDPRSGFGALGSTIVSAVRRSLHDALTGLRATAPPAASGPIQLHVIVRRYVVAPSAVGGSRAVVCVAWAGVVDEQVVFTEQFFATASAAIVNLRPAGTLQRALSSAIAHKIVEGALHLPADKELAARRWSISTPGTYRTFEEFGTSLPSKFLGGVPASNVTVGNTYAMSGDWSWANPAGPADWLHLQQQAAIPDVASPAIVNR